MHITETKKWKSITNATISDLSSTMIELIEFVTKNFKLTQEKIQTLANFVLFEVEKEDPQLRLRFLEIQKLGKDSSSLKSNILRFGETEGKKRYEKKREQSKITLELYVRKYGEEKGKKKFDEYLLSLSHSLDGYIFRHGKKKGKEKFDHYWRNTNFSASLDAFIRRHGEKLGKEKYKEFCVLAGKRSSGEAWEDKDAYRKMVAKRSRKIKDNPYDRDNLSLQKFINRDGDSQGKENYETYWKEHRKTNRMCYEYYQIDGVSEEEAENQKKDYHVQLELNNRDRKYRASKSSITAFLPGYKFLRRSGISKNSIWWGVGESTEYFIREKNDIRFYDFTVPELKIIVEFNGSRYHPTKKHLQEKLSATSIAGCSNIQDIKDRYQRDLDKVKLAKKNGYSVLILWDTETKEKNHRRLLKFLGDHVCKVKSSRSKKWESKKQETSLSQEIGCSG